MKLIIITTNDDKSIAAMGEHVGALLVKSDTDFAVWYCSGLTQMDIDEISGYNGATNIKIVGMLMLNVPQ
jgi:hypothetical protein